MPTRNPCPICSIPMRTDHIVKHMYKHRKILSEVMTPEAIEWSINQKVPYMYKLNKEKPGKSFGICLVCKEGRTEHSSLGDWKEWSHLHRKKSKKCMEKFSEVEKYFGVKTSVASESSEEEKESEEEIVRSPETPQQPPSPPQLVIQNVEPTPEPSNELRYEFNSEDIDWEETGSEVSCSPMDSWNFEDRNVKRIFDVLSDILEQGMPYKFAKANYLELLLELRSFQDEIGKPFKVLQAYLKDEYTLKDLDHFLTVYE